MISPPHKEELPRDPGLLISMNAGAISLESHAGCAERWKGGGSAGGGLEL